MVKYLCPHCGKEAFDCDMLNDGFMHFWHKSDYIAINCKLTRKEEELFKKNPKNYIKKGWFGW